MKVAIYIRVSTEDQAREGTSLEVQREFLEAYAKRNEYEVFYPEHDQVYMDDGYSGYTNDRPALRRLIEDAKAKKFEIVLVYKIDRFARNNRLLLNLVEDLNDLEIGFKSATEDFNTITASGKMALSMLGTIAQFERVRPGMIKGVEKGNWQGSRYAPYGYSYNKEKKLLKVVKSEADIVKLIYTMYLSNKSTVQITKYLYEKGYKTRSGGKFYSKLVRDILRNKTYLGKIVWNKHSYDFKQKTRKGYKYLKNSPDKVIEGDGKHKAIIDEIDFYKVQKKLDKNRRGALHRNTPSEYPLAGIVYCADDNHKFRGARNTSNRRTKSKKRWYRCGAKHERGITCTNKSIKAEELEPIVFGIIEKILSHPDIQNGRIDGLISEYEIKDDCKLQDEKKKIQGKVQANIEKQQKLFKAYSNNLIAEEVYEDNCIDLRNEESNLKKQLSSIDMKMLENQRSENYKHLLKSVIQNFDKTKEEMDPITKKEFLQLIIKRILLKDKKIVTLELYQPFERYLKEQECNINLTIPMGNKKPYLLRPMAVK